MTLAGGFAGKLYRALNPIWAARPLSGEGAAQYGGRFNPRGMPALYCSLDPLTALREAHQAGDLQPTTLVSLDAVIENVFDGRSQSALGQLGLSPDDLAESDWRDLMVQGLEPRSHGLARKLVATGCSALLVRSFARGSRQTDFNLVLWAWSDKPPSRVRLIDDENRLG